MPYGLGLSNRMTDSEGLIIEGFHYDPETFSTGYAQDGEFISAELPCPLPNSPPNPQFLGYTGPTMS